MACFKVFGVMGKMLICLTSGCNEKGNEPEGQISACNSYLFRYAIKISPIFCLLFSTFAYFSHCGLTFGLN
jgi:hypothetical protein